MIKRKQTKKSKSKKRKNPKLDEIPLTLKEIDDLFHDITGALFKGKPYYLVDAIHMLKIGQKCTDCGENVIFCQCELCEDCKLQKCLCQYNIDYQSPPHDIRILTWEFAKAIFNDRDLQFIKSRVLSIIENKNDQKLLKELKIIMSNMDKSYYELD